MAKNLGDVAATEPTDGSRPGSLRALLDTLGSHALRLVSGTDDGLDEPAGEPVVHGAGEPLQDVGDGIVLLTGARPAEASTLTTLRQVAAAGGRSVVLKAWGQDLGAAVATATAAGLTLLCTPDEMAWRHLDALISVARLAETTIDHDAGLTGQDDLFSLADAIAASLGGPVTIEETSGRILAYSNLPGQEIDEIRRLAILGRQTPDRPSNTEQYQAVLQASGRPVLLESSHPEYASRLAVAVGAGHQMLGVIFVLCDRPRLVEDAERVLVDAARATALRLLRERGPHDPDRARRGESLRGLLTGELDAPSAAAGLALPPTGSVVMAVARPTPGAGLRSVDAARIADLVALHGAYWHGGAVSVVDGGDLLLLLPVPETPDEPRARERLSARLRKVGTDLVAAVRRSASVDLLVGFGPVVPGLHGVQRSRELADRVLDVLEERGGTVATLGEVRAPVVLAGLRSGRPVQDGDEDLELEQVRAVLEHDAAQGTDYALTLLTYLGAFGNIVATAHALNVHENTARYRVRRLIERFGVELDSGDETLVTWLQLRNALGGRGPLSPPTRSNPAIGT